MGYDVKCELLAVDFLDDEPPELQTEKNVERLAQVIQDAIESEILDMQEQRKRAV
jgi:hypothetical protein